jgi:hypothetical protein
VYCPNCGTKNASTPQVSCTKCNLPLGPVHQHLEANRTALALVERTSRERTERLVAHALFLGIAAIPVGIAARNSLQSRK